MTPAAYNRSLPAPGEYARSWKTLASLPPGKIVSVPGWIVGMAGWSRQTVTAGLALLHIQNAAQQRINARAGLNKPRGRKDDPEYQMRLRRDANAIRDHITRHVRVYQFETAEARSRLSHLLACRDD